MGFSIPLGSNIGLISQWLYFFFKMLKIALTKNETKNKNLIELKKKEHYLCDVLVGTEVYYF